MIDSASALLGPLPSPDLDAAEAVRERAAQVLRPIGALSRLDEIAVWLAGWQGTSTPRVDEVSCIVFAADHGVAARGVSAYPPAVTESMLRALNEGVATASVMCSALGVELSVVDVGVGRPTGDIRVEAALDESGFEACWVAGVEAVEILGRTDLLVLGEMGIGNTTAAAAVSAALFGGDAEIWTGLGTGVDEETLERKKRAVEAARRRVEGADPLQILRQVGGSELVAIAGAVSAARSRSIPVVLDGFVVTSACAALEVARPGALDHAVAGHCSAEPGHRLLLDKLGKPPILDLAMRLGEASGALAAVPLIRLAACCVTDVATFGEWGLGR
ncbi:MAG TPA: nicotinate-nucleotide--dimethylbenzimidazole phosphoribosyltransferase [Acidimicrobiia bacterium]|nr:nicotinate-nucleotide--dimethylbenzimidazole phosphoribosyltransferase [Acidimicrobiia bacterium]